MPSALIYFLRKFKEESSRLIPTGANCQPAARLLRGAREERSSFPSFSAAQLLARGSSGGSILFDYHSGLRHDGETGRAVTEGIGSFLASYIVRVSQPAATLVMLLCMLALHRLNPISAGFVYTIASVPTLLIVLSQVRHLTLGRWRMDVASCRLLLSYGLRSYGVDILGALSLQVDQVLVISMLAPEAMGIYGVTLSLSRMFNLFQNSVVTVLFPSASGRSADEIGRMTEYSVSRQHAHDRQLRGGGVISRPLHAQDSVWA